MNEERHIKSIIKSYRENLTSPDNTWPYDIRLAMNYVNQNIFAPDFSVQAMKEKCNIKEQNFSSRFRNYAGRTPRDYVILHRMKIVKALLIDVQLAELPINTIGFLAGYEKPSSFTMTFRKRTGTTPGHWRQKALKK